MAIESIHQSSLNMALRCGEQFRRRYIEGEIIPPSIAAARGTSLHHANEVNLVQKVATGVDLPVVDLQDAARDKFVETLQGGVFLSRDELPDKNKVINEGLNQAIVLTGLYHAEVAPELSPVEVERQFSIDIGVGIPIAGRIDIEQNGQVDDLKSAAKSWPEGKIDQELQPVFYSLAYEHEFGTTPEFVYHILVASKTPRHQVQRRRCTDKDYGALKAKIQVFLKMIKAGVFLPADPSSWGCNEKWCGYFTTCAYVGNQMPKTWI